MLVLEGFSPTHWQALGSHVPANPSGDAANFPGIHFNRTHVVPPCTISADELREGLAILDEALTVADAHYVG